MNWRFGERKKGQKGGRETARKIELLGEGENERLGEWENERKEERKISHPKALYGQRFPCPASLM